MLALSCIYTIASLAIVYWCRSVGRSVLNLTRRPGVTTTTKGVRTHAHHIRAGLIFDTWQQRYYF